MRITFSQLKKLKIETKSGQMLGKISDIIFDVEGQSAAQYLVKGSVVSTKKYLISRSQVIKIDEEKMIVDDNVEEITDGISEEKKKRRMDVEPAV